MQAREPDRPRATARRRWRARVKAGVLWRSGSQIGGQLIAWGATFLVLRLLSPGDYGLVAMTGAVLAFLDLFKGWGFASALVRHERTDSLRIGQAFGAADPDQRRARRDPDRAGAARRRLFPPADGRRSAARAGALLSRQPVHRARPCAAGAAARVQAPVANRSRRGGAERRDRAGLRAGRARRVDAGRRAGHALVRARRRLHPRDADVGDPAALPLRRAPASSSPTAAR